MKNIIDSIEKLKPYTNNSITNIRNANIPTLYELNLERRYSFSTHGFKHSHFSELSLVYLSNNIPFTTNQPRHTYADTLDNLVKSGEVLPFLLFFNHEFIKWSNILIIKDCKYSYLVVLDYSGEVYTKECIIIPQDVIYTEGSDTISENTIFAFNSINNKLCTESSEGDTYTTIDLVLNRKNIYYECKEIVDINEFIETGLEPDAKIDKDNIFIFNNGCLATYITVDIEALNMFKINSVLTQGNFVYKLFSYNKSNKSKDNIYNIKNLNDLLQYIKTKKNVPQYVKDLSEPFDFKYDKNLSYEENVYNALNYIMRYNSSLLDDIYKKKANIVSKLFTGKQIKSNMDKFGFTRMSRRVGTGTSTNVIIFVNGELYKAYNELKYKNKDFIFPVIDIEDEDIIEILYFTDVDNRRIKLNFSSTGDDRYIVDSSINMDNMKLFTMNPGEATFNIERKDYIQYEIGFSYEKQENQIIKIIPEDSFYYDRTLSLVSERQFHYACKIAKDKCINMILPEEFRFCNDINRYMIFVNGRKMDSNNFKVTIPKPTRPFDEISVYINIILEKGDKLEVFYVPEVMEELVIEQDLDLSGVVSIDKSKIAYNLNKDLYMIFINGKKINSEQMFNIDQSRLKIISGVESVNNLSIIKHVKDDEILSELFNENKDKITEILQLISSQDLDILYNSDTVSIVEENIKSDQISMKLVMYKLINDYYLRPYVYNGNEFIYDFDETDLDVDEEGNIILDSFNAELEDKLDI